MNEISKKIKILFLFISVIFSIIILRLWYLQIVNGSYFRYLSENNRFRTVYVPAPRGNIYASDGTLLATTRPGFNIEIIPEDVENLDYVLAELSRLSNISVETLRERMSKQRKRKRFQPKLLIEDADRSLVAKVMARRYHLQGISVTVTPIRQYLFGSLAAHTLGYIGEISKEQLSTPKYASYSVGDMIGKYGLEASYESFLRGIRGIQRLEVNAKGAKIAEYEHEPDRMGNDLRLTIDFNLQKTAETALDGKKGAIVAMNPQNGAILAIASAPSFDPNLFSSGLTSKAWKAITDPSQNRMLNRATQGLYPPASVFKLFMAFAGLSEGIIYPSSTTYCSGAYKFANRIYKCHKHTGHGKVDLYSALVQSCDVFFYELGLELGIDLISRYAKMFGFGQKLDLSFAESKKGIVPSPEWKRSFFKNEKDKVWFQGETLSVAIGQGAFLVTPLQVAVAVSALVNGGKIMLPQIVKEIRNGNGDILMSFIPRMIGKVQIKKGIIEEIKKAMVGVVYDEKGTGKLAKPDYEGIRIGGKTGTAQVVSLENMKKKDAPLSHAWFAGVAPINDPKISVVVLIENGGSGGAGAAPIAKKIFDAYFSES